MSILNSMESGNVQTVLLDSIGIELNRIALLAETLMIHVKNVHLWMELVFVMFVMEDQCLRLQKMNVCQRLRIVLNVHCLNSLDV